MTGPLIPGRLIERYRVEELIGEGGTAAVYRVRHVHLGTEHALKVMTLFGAQAGPRLLLEGRVQAGLRHPNVVTVFDVIEVDGSFGLLMEYVPAPSLSVWIGQNPPRVELAEALFRGIVEGVRHAHAHGLVHRDLKPANVLLARVDAALVPGGLIPKVADFGLARLLDSDAHRHTRSGLAMGTPQYMAPEQFRDAKAVDRRADLFSLGCILHELLSGAPAFPWTDLIGVYTAMAGRSWAPLPPGVPERLRAVIAGCLDPDPDTRIPDCGSLLSLLDGVGPARGPTLVPSAPVLAHLDIGVAAQDAPTVFRPTPIAWAPTPIPLPVAAGPPAHPALATGRLVAEAEGTLLPAGAPDPRSTGLREAPDTMGAPTDGAAGWEPSTHAPPQNGRFGALIGAGSVGLALVALLAWALRGPPSDAGPVAVPPTPPVADVTPPVEPPPVELKPVELKPVEPDPVVTPPSVPPKDRPTGSTRPQDAKPVVIVTPDASLAADPPMAASVTPPTPAADTRASVRATGAQTVWLEGATGKHSLPARVPPGRYQVWADFGAGAVPTNEVTLGARDEVTLRCIEDFQSCPAQ